ncbi:MAG: hypothetical protein JST49_03665 [Bacteroidetes bacterium]|nr:hypothetical protein [Bacteroidota bacterium]
MKKMILPLAVFALLSSVASCSRCYVCVDKDQDEFTKTEVCDKDYDKGDVRERIEFYENLGMTCHAKSRAF